MSPIVRTSDVPNMSVSVTQTACLLAREHTSARVALVTNHSLGLIIGRDICEHRDMEAGSDVAMNPIATAIQAVDLSLIR